jgi:hypothetical protein
VLFQQRCCLRRHVIVRAAEPPNEQTLEEDPYRQVQDQPHSARRCYYSSKVLVAVVLAAEGLVESVVAAPS